MLSPKYRPDIDGLRAIAVLSVVIFHAFPDFLKGGFIGVDVFFVISGFLISSIIFENLDRGEFEFSTFYSRRINRIFPALLLVLIVTYSFGWLNLLAEDYRHLGKHIAGGSVFISNFLLWQESGYFDTAANTKPLLHLWSLGIEEQFYIAWPLILWFCRKRVFGFLLIIAALLLLSFFMNLKNITHDPVATFYSPLTRVWELLSGSLLAWMVFFNRCSFKWGASKLEVLGVKLCGNPGFWKRVLTNISSLFGFVLLGYGLLTIDKGKSFPGIWAIVPVLGAVLIILAGSKAWINSKILSNKVFVWFGLISFPLYLWHWPLFAFAKIVEFSDIGNYFKCVLIAISILFAWLSYRFVEVPLRLLSNIKLKASFLVFIMAIFGCLGFVTYSKEGFVSRRAEQYSRNLYSDEARDFERGLGESFKNYYGKEGSNKPIILVIGDSYVTNWAVGLSRAINLGKYDMVAISYLGCDFSFPKNEVIVKEYEGLYKDRCEKFKKYINDPSVINRIESIMLASHRPFSHLSYTQRFDLIKFLKKQKDIHVVVFGNYYQTDSEKIPSCEKLMYKYSRRAEICLRHANYPNIHRSIQSEPFFPVDLKFSYIDFRKAVCGSARGECPTEFNGVPFMSDWNHLNAAFLINTLPQVFKDSEVLNKYIE